MNKYNTYIGCFALLLVQQLYSQVEFVDPSYGAGLHYKHFKSEVNVWVRSELIKGESTYRLLCDKSSDEGRLGKTSLYVKRGASEDLLCDFLRDIYAESYLVDIEIRSNRIELIIKHSTGYRYLILKKKNDEYAIVYGCDFLVGLFDGDNKVSSILITGEGNIEYVSGGKLSTVKVSLPNFTINGVESGSGIVDILKHASYSCQADLYSDISHSSLRLSVWSDYFNASEEDKSKWVTNLVGLCGDEATTNAIFSESSKNVSKYLNRPLANAKDLSVQLGDTVFVISEDGVMKDPDINYDYYLIVRKGVIKYINFTANGPLDPLF